ncbi:hypothetical protein C1631_006475 [Chryseobacterium phosphatilyticum]|uniref:RHS repeat-associated core domain-containing protein n=1 Tax=Chryseobacterium phosphatilyticum TaxID=475075 RepID=A0A316XMS3_9FLAO|nr:RHS repeat-associated core domain-containing protein [Chryseobacterium phosphatilyticum]PWN72240.1 hypothetical protein C1631_006475 [Chryseobacterium phosphatilyticum]
MRLAYYKDASGNLKIDRTTHYYPFGLEFGGELSTSNSITPNYTYSSQGQEKQRETGWSSYRWRNYDSAMGRFFNVDPLAETYHTWSPFAFSGNRVVDARELEGLEPKKVNEETPLLDRTTNGLKTFFSGVTNFFNEKFNIKREMAIQRNIDSREIMMLDRLAGKSAALGQMGRGLSETMKGSAYALGEVLDKGGEYTSSAALLAAPATEGASLALIPPAEAVSNFGWGIKFGVDFSDGKYSDVMIEGSKKIISTGIGKMGEGLLNKTFKLNPSMTKTEKAIHETVIGGSATVVSKSAESVIDKKTKKLNE